jgi:ankyrin repeat protein
VEQQIDTDALETIWDKLGWTLAHTAAAAGSADVLKKVLQENHHLFYWGDDQGRTPVHVAAQHRHLDQFEIEVPYLTAMDALYSTPLHAAALNSSLHQVADSLTPEMLLVINLQGQSILDLAPELSETNESTPAKLRQTAWEARFIRDPERRTVESVLQHIGIRPK